MKRCIVFLLCLGLTSPANAGEGFRTFMAGMRPQPVMAKKEWYRPKPRPKPEAEVKPALFTPKPKTTPPPPSPKPAPKPKTPKTLPVSVSPDTLDPWTLRGALGVFAKLEPKPGALVLRQKDPIPERGILVNVTTKVLRFYDGKSLSPALELPVEISRVGLGTERGSKRTPLGTFTVTKEPGHRFGPVLRLSGYQGSNRGILIHRDMSKGEGTNGCVTCKRGMADLFKLVNSGDSLRITS